MTDSTPRASLRRRWVRHALLDPMVAAGATLLSQFAASWGARVPAVVLGGLCGLWFLGILRACAAEVHLAPGPVRVRLALRPEATLPARLSAPLVFAFLALVLPPGPGQMNREAILEAAFRSDLEAADPRFGTVYFLRSREGDLKPEFVRRFSGLPVRVELWPADRPEPLKSMVRDEATGEYGVLLTVGAVRRVWPFVGCALIEGSSLSGPLSAEAHRYRVAWQGGTWKVTERMVR